MPCLTPGCSDDIRDRAVDVPPCLALRGCGRSPRESGAPPSTPRPPAIRDPTPSVARGPRLLGLVVPSLGRLAGQSRHRPARHGAGLAPPRLPALLAPEVQRPAGGPSAARPRASPADPADGTRESDVGPAAHSGRPRLARLRGRRTDRRQVHAPDLASAVTHVARLSHRPCPRDRRHRLLRGSHPHLPPALRLRCPAASPPRTPPRQRDGSPLSSLDGPAGDRGVPGGDRRRNTSFGIETRSTARPSLGASTPWESGR